MRWWGKRRKPEQEPAQPITRQDIRVALDNLREVTEMLTAETARLALAQQAKAKIRRAR